MCSPGCKGHEDLTSSTPSSGLSPAVSPEGPLAGGNWKRGLRSLRDLTQHLTTRADDSHAAPVRNVYCYKRRSLAAAFPCQTLVRFCALLRIKPHAPPLVRAPVNSFEFHTCVRTPQAAYLTRLLRYPGRTPDTQYASFTVRTTRVSNPVCYPHFRASASMSPQQAAFAIGVLPDLYAFHRYTRNSACP